MPTSLLDTAKSMTQGIFEAVRAVSRETPLLN